MSCIREQRAVPTRLRSHIFIPGSTCATVVWRTFTCLMAHMFYIYIYTHHDTYIYIYIYCIYSSCCLDLRCVNWLSVLEHSRKYTTVYNATLCYITLCYPIQRYILSCCTVLYCTLPYCTVLHYTTQYTTYYILHTTLYII